MIQEKLYLLRKKNGLSQRKVAKLLDINYKTYSQKELGHSEFNANEMFKLSQFFNMPIEDIFIPPILQNGVKEKIGGEKHD